MINEINLPERALLHPYVLRNAYTDCYYIDIPKSVSFSQYIYSFYTTPLFKVERSLLAVIARRPSTDKQAEDLAKDFIKRFAAWDVENRTNNQLLLCDYMGRTRSWLMTEPIEMDGSTGTRLFFGSAVIPKFIGQNGAQSFGLGFHFLLGFHRLYTKALMRSAELKLNKLNYS